MLEEIRSLLEGLGVALKESDNDLLDMFINDVTGLIELETNRGYSSKADPVLKSLVTAKFLNLKRLTDKESLTGFNLTGAGSISSITVGDTATAFNSDGKSSEELLDEFITRLEASKKLPVKLRGLKW